MHIGEFELKNPFILAPMAGITDHPFRLICKKQGAGLVYTEFVSAEGIIRENEKTLNMIRFTEAERPIGVQIFGDKPEALSQSAKYIYDTFNPDIIDINFGCPVPKVTKKGGGSAALKDLCLMEDIVNAVVDACYKSIKSKKWEKINLEIWRGKEGVDKISTFANYDEKYYLVKEEMTHYGDKKLILKNKSNGEIIEKIVEKN